MSTQITATQSSFANQAPEVSTAATNKVGENSEDKLSKDLTHRVERAKKNDKLTNEASASNASKPQTASELKNEQESLVLDEALEVIADFMQLSSRNINFQQDDVSDKTVIKFFDTESKELIKQFPSEEVLEIAQKIIALRQDVGEKTGIFLEEKV
ncbi:Uncharacterized conserved protein, FlaG/YvyC family [Colwellia chukchiensis]|uniref:Uncharacterized conserved protein, FlaG/YvyC family n=1 Tax=Colwellia chukchiensis TaxID=641665 RepID=A0A1H7HHH1_9GAMM|nr:flagellar protein FlaG [Colwellia chukchiensis]SEK49739.1 Uncharacterized conserved protein, FlaG/YvyC family [Colwellia chukchiensis]